MNIRPVEIADLPAVVGLCAAHADYERLIYKHAGQAQRLKSALFAAEPKLYMWVVAAADGQLMGYMSATLDYSTWSAAPFVYMDCLYLDESLRGQGWGRQLLVQLANFAEAKQCAEIQWQTPPDNTSGIGFYQRMGATSLPKSRFQLSKGQGAWNR